MKNYQIESLPRISNQISQQMVDYIVEDNLQVGTKLPTERQLCTILEVSRSSVREGIRVLELLGYLVSKQGGGTFVSSPPPFMIPTLVINQKLKKEELDYYFDMLFMCAETVIRSYFSENHNLPHQVFSGDIVKLFLFMASELSNPYYFSLLKQLFELLMRNNYLDNKIETTDWNFVIEFLQTKDVENFLKVLQTLRQTKAK